MKDLNLMKKMHMNMKSLLILISIIFHLTKLRKLLPLRYSMDLAFYKFGDAVGNWYYCVATVYAKWLRPVIQPCIYRAFAVHQPCVCCAFAVRLGTGMQGWCSA